MAGLKIRAERTRRDAFPVVSLWIAKSLIVVWAFLTLLMISITNKFKTL